MSVKYKKLQHEPLFVPVCRKMNEEETKQLASKLMKEVYSDGFNIYQCLNRLKKKLKLRVDFPPQAIIWTCEEYLRTKSKVQSHYPWFVRVFKASSERYFSEQHVKESKTQNKRGGFAPSIKKIMEGM